MKGKTIVISTVIPVLSFLLVLDYFVAQDFENNQKELELQIQNIQEEKNLLKDEKNSLESKIQNIQQENNVLKNENDLLKSEITPLQSEMGYWKNNYQEALAANNAWQEAYEQQHTTYGQYVNTLQNMTNEYSTQLYEYQTDKLRMLQQGSEVVFYRQMNIHNYKTADTHVFSWNIPFNSYYTYRSNSDGHALPGIGTEEAVRYYKTALNTWEDLKPLADLLRMYAGNDDELFANLALQVTHQFYYKPTDNTKFPIETFVEGSGDCDTLAVFAAALMKAGGLDTVVATAWVKGSEENKLGLAHAIVGVALDVPPDDFGKHEWYVDTEDGKRYYFAEATWSNQFVKPWEYYEYGRGIVGNNPWGQYQLVEVVQTPESGNG